MEKGRVLFCIIAPVVGGGKRGKSLRHAEYLEMSLGYKFELS
jgi:hypothetical protein